MKKALVILTGLSFLLGLGALTNQAQGGKLPSIKGSKVLMIIASKDFRLEEYEVPREILEGQGAKVIVASSQLSSSVDMSGKVKVKPNILLKKVEVKDYEAIIFVGGRGAEEYWNSKEVHSIVREAVKEGRILGAICIAPVILARAGILKGKRATVWPGCAKELKKEGVKYTGKDVEVAGRIITANGPLAAKWFAEALVKKIFLSKFQDVRPDEFKP